MRNLGLESVLSLILKQLILLCTALGEVMAGQDLTGEEAAPLGFLNYSEHDDFKKH